MGERFYGGCARLVAVRQSLKANRRWQAAKSTAAFCSLDANEHFQSRSRCFVPCCCQRQVEETDAQGHKRTVTEYYHRTSSLRSRAQVQRAADLEPIRPGEAEAEAALRLLGRMRRLYAPAFFDGIMWTLVCARPFLKALDKLGWAWKWCSSRSEWRCFKKHAP